MGVKSNPIINMLKYKEIHEINGAEDGNNLEPFSAPLLLEELENWAEILKSEPEVIHRLAAFAAVAADVGDDRDDSSDHRANECPAVLSGIEP